MMNLRACLAVSVIALAAACSGSSNPLVGTWTCESNENGGKMVVESTYQADGKTKGVGEISMSQPGMAMDMKLSFSGTWKQEGDQLTEQMTNVKIEKATMNGQPFPSEALTGMTEEMKMPQTTTVKIDGNTLTQTDSGVSVTCKK